MAKNAEKKRFDLEEADDYERKRLRGLGVLPSAHQELMDAWRTTTPHEVLVGAVGEKLVDSKKKQTERGK